MTYVRNSESDSDLRLEELFDWTLTATNLQRPRHPSSREKTGKPGVETYLNPNAAALITTEGARACAIYFLFRRLSGIKLSSFFVDGSVLIHWLCED